MSLEDYIGQIREIAGTLFQMSTGEWESLERLYEDNTGSFRQIVAWRTSQLVPSDVARAEGYLPTGYLKSADTTRVN